MIGNRPWMFSMSLESQSIFFSVSNSVTQICQQCWATNLSKYPVLSHEVTRWGKQSSLLRKICQFKAAINSLFHYQVFISHSFPPKIACAFSLPNDLWDAYLKLEASPHLNTLPRLMFWLGCKPQEKTYSKLCDSAFRNPLLYTATTCCLNSSCVNLRPNFS